MSETGLLTSKEGEVAELYAAGATFGDIAQQLGRSPHTVRTHLKTIYRKLGVNSKIALAAALRHEHQAERGHVGLDQMQRDLALLRVAQKRIGHSACDDRAQTRAILQELITRHPGLAAAHAGLAFLSGRKAFPASCPENAAGLLDEALRHAETALGQNGLDADAHLAMGRVLSFEGSLATGEKHIRLALDCAPDFEWAQYMLCFVLMHQGRNDEAIRVGEAYMKTIRDCDVIEPMTLTLACAHFSKGDYGSAMHWSTSLLQRNRAYSQLRLTASVILAGAGKLSEVEALAGANPIDVFDMTPVQSRLHARSGRVFDALERHRDDLRSLFSGQT